MDSLERIANDPRVRIRKAGLNAQAKCVVYWMRRSQRGSDNAALNVAIQAGNILKKPVLVFFGLTPKAHISGYATRRNKPDLDGTSQLSPYLHFGQIAPHTVTMAVQEADAPLQDRTAFLEELIVRRELAVNFVRYNSNCCRSQVRFAWIESRMSGASQQHSDTADTHHSNSADGVSLTPLVQEFGTRI
jgi:deoxyribodipyrimidine photolyase